MGARALIAAAVLFACACGPRPRVRSVSARRSGGKMVVEVAVDNPGGEGEASVTVRLKNRATGAVFAKEDGLPMKAGQPATAALELAAPEGDYEVSAQAQYPP